MSQSQDEIEYRKLINLFKYLITASGIVIGGIIGVAMYYSYHDLKELKQELKDEIGEMKKDINSLKSYAQNTIDETQDRTYKQLSILKDEAKLLALNSTRERVNEAFKDGNIQYLVEKTAKEELKDKLDKIVQSETERLELILDEIPTLTVAYDQIRCGNRSYLDTLYSIQKNSDHGILRDMAKALILQKGRDYEDSEAEVYPFDDNIASRDSLNRKLLKDALKQFKIKSVPDKNKKEILDLIKIIETDKDLYKVMAATIILREMLNTKIEMFDFEKIESIKIKYIK
jgi:hypothetical protein